MTRGFGPPRLTPATVARATAAVVVLARLARAARPLPAVTVSADTDEPCAIDVVVPARDEAARIGPLLAAVVGAPGVREVIVVDDGSTDATADIARAAGARVVPGAALPAGWAGKAWALQQGIEAAVADWVVMLDADTRPDPRLPQALVARATADRSDLLTVAGRFELPTVGARWLHAAMLTTLVYRFGPVGSVARARRGRIVANGQCVTARRSSLLAAGAMAPVAGEVVEDVALARHVAATGGRVAFLDASSLLTVRMYESFGDVWRGWGRSLALPGVEPGWRQSLDVAVLAVTQALPLVRLVAGRADAIDAVLLAARAGTLAGTARVYARADAAYWCSPLADGIAVVALATGALNRRRTWRGRDYAAPRRLPARTARR